MCYIYFSNPNKDNLFQHIGLCYSQNNKSLFIGTNRDQQLVANVRQPICCALTQLQALLWSLQLTITCYPAVILANLASYSRGPKPRFHSLVKDDSHSQKFLNQAVKDIPFYFYLILNFTDNRNLNEKAEQDCPPARNCSKVLPS